MKILILLLPLIILFSSCDEGAGGPPPEEEEEVQMGGGTPEAGGGGQVALAGGEAQGTIADRYESALKKIKKRDWDGAREELLEALARSEGKDIQEEIKGHLKLVERGILSQPTHLAGEVFGDQDKMLGKKVSMRGYFSPGGPVGKVSYYFWLDAGGKVQCRYDALPLESKKKILMLDEGAVVLVRGTLKSPWGSNPNPYLELSYFRLEKLAPKKKKAASTKENDHAL